ncbi:MAG: fumarate hydratase [Desulfobacteraceae bacterium]|nr:MAG: fumarate hydratase [Desulfobacteraceae bacterium]
MKPKREILQLSTPLPASEFDRLEVGQPIEITGTILCGRDAVLPRIVDRIENGVWDELGIDLNGAVIFHTAVSPAGIGPTTTNKVEIESSLPALSKAGVRIHIGKGSIGPDTTEALNRYGSVFAVTPPVTALFSDKILSRRIAAFPEEGIEALYELRVRSFPAIIASAHGKTIFSD